jgi:hypothetical protein
MSARRIASSLLGALLALSLPAAATAVSPREMPALLPAADVLSPPPPAAGELPDVGPGEPAALVPSVQTILQCLPGGCGQLRVVRRAVPGHMTATATLTFPPDCASPAARFARALHPLSEPLAGLLPADALAAWELGVSPVEVATLYSALLLELAPGQHAWLSERLAEARAAGVDPFADLLPALGVGLAGALLRPEQAPDGWPLPRPVWVARVDDEDAAQRAVAALLEWEAGAVAEVSGGLASASIVREQLLGVTVTGLQVESFTDVPMPSPAVAFVHGLLVVSPVRSAVRDAVGAILDRGGLWPAGGRPGPEGPVAVLRANPAAAFVALRPAAGPLARIAALLRAPVDTSEADSALGALEATLAVGRSYQRELSSARVLQGEAGTQVVIESELNLQEAVAR